MQLTIATSLPNVEFAFQLSTWPRNVPKPKNAIPTRNRMILSQELHWSVGMTLHRAMCSRHGLQNAPSLHFHQHLAPQIPPFSSKVRTLQVRLEKQSEQQLRELSEYLRSHGPCGRRSLETKSADPPIPAPDLTRPRGASIDPNSTEATWAPYDSFDNPKGGLEEPFPKPQARAGVSPRLGTSMIGVIPQLASSPLYKDNLQSGSSRQRVSA